MTDVLITGADTITGYNTARAIQDASIRIWGLASRADAWECTSNLWSKLDVVDTGADALLDKLLQLGQVFQNKHGSDNKIILFPSQDYAVEAISIHRQQLSKYFNFVLPEHKTIERLMDKTLFHEWALTEGFLVPKSAIVSNHQELASSLQKLRYPIIIKPLVRTEEWDKRNIYLKGVSLDCAADLKSYPFDLFLMCDRYIVQEWITGGDDQIYFCLMYLDRDGKEKASFTGRKLLQWPLDNGSTSICKALPDERLRYLTFDVLSSAGMIGLGSLEFKYSQKHDQFFLIEPTVGRNDHQSYISVCAGINISKIALDDTLGVEDRNSRKLRSAIWIDEMAAVRGIRKIKDYRLLIKLLWYYFIFNKSFAAFNFADPKPFYHFIARLIRTFFRKITSSFLEKK